MISAFVLSIYNNQQIKDNFPLSMDKKKPSGSWFNDKGIITASCVVGTRILEWIATYASSLNSAMNQVWFLSGEGRTHYLLSFRAENNSFFVNKRIK